MTAARASRSPQPLPRRVDVVVVGGGGAGLSAAATASESGRSVLVVESAAELGGTARIALGAVVGNGTPQQRRAGIIDGPDAHEADWVRLVEGSGAEDNLALRRRYVEEIGGTITWVTCKGVSFAGPFDDPANRVPRLHMALPGSRAIVSRLAALARRRGAAIALNARVRELLHEPGAGVFGVVVERDGKRYPVHANRGVVLASGDYSAGDDLKRRLLGDELGDVPGINPLSRGDGHRLGESVDARIVDGTSVLGPQLRLAPPDGSTWLQRLPNWPAVSKLSLLAQRHLPAQVTRRLTASLLTTYVAVAPSLLDGRGLVVDRAGVRVDPVARKPGEELFVVLDRTLAARFDRWPDFVSTAPGIAYAYISDFLRARPDACVRDDDIRSVAQTLGIHADGLAASVAAHFASEDGPYVGLGPLRDWIVVTNGGLAVSRDLWVLDSNGDRITGLYAAGSVGQGGLQLKSNGLHLGWALVSGRIAGAAVARGPGNETGEVGAR